MQCSERILTPYRSSTDSLSVLICPSTLRTAFSIEPLLCDSPTGDSSNLIEADREVTTLSNKARIAGSSSDFNTIDAFLYPSWRIKPSKLSALYDSSCPP